MLAEIYETLTYLPGGSLEPEPLLAESWEVSEDGLNYTFTLKPDITFTTGNPLNAEAVKFSIDRLHEIGLGPLYMTSAYDSTEVVDDMTVRMTLKFPYAAWPVILSNPAVLGVIDPAFVEENGGSTPDERNDYVSTHTAGTWSLDARASGSRARGSCSSATLTTGRVGTAITSTKSSSKRSRRNRPGCSVSSAVMSISPR